jgi:hypothetical protein
MDNPSPRLCPNCREPYIARTLDVPQMRLVERTEGSGCIAEEYVSTDATVSIPESHLPCRNVWMRTSATEDGTWK